MTGRGVLALVGLRCVGKSTVGRILADRHGVPFVDLDDELVAEWRSGARVPGREPVEAGSLLASLGVTAFRALELAALRRVLSGLPPTAAGAVLATGGGCVETPEARSLLSANTTTVWLREDPDVLAERLRADARTRPSLTGVDAGAELRELERSRGPLYEGVADLAVDGQGQEAAALAERVLAALTGLWPARQTEGV